MEDKNKIEEHKEHLKEIEKKNNSETTDLKDNKKEESREYEEFTSKHIEDFEIKTCSTDEIPCSSVQIEETSA